MRKNPADIGEEAFESVVETTSFRVLSFGVKKEVEEEKSTIDLLPPNAFPDSVIGGGLIEAASGLWIKGMVRMLSLRNHLQCR